jgi:flagellar basal body-associated protein FliL
MVKTIARAVFLFAMAIMIASWAMTISNSEPAQPEQELPTDRMYS